MPSSFSPQPSFTETVIDNANSLAFNQFFAIYEEALPAAERKPRAIIEHLIDRPDYRFLALKDDDECIVAFAIVFVSENNEVGLLEYMATKMQFRDAGLGARIFGMALAIMGNRVMLVEVDSEREAAPDREIRIRRKNFYFNQGCIQVPDLDYVMPSVAIQKPSVMDLLYHPGDRAISLTPDRVRTWLATVYTEVYGRNSLDPDIKKMMMTFKG